MPSFLRNAGAFPSYVRPHLSALVVGFLGAFWIFAASFPNWTVVAQDAQLRFRSHVEVVELAVLARDRSGRPVTDLTERDLTISEDDVPQKIVGFERVSLPIPVRPAVSAAPASVPPADVSSNEQVAESRIYVLLLDALHIAPGRNGQVRQYARRFIEEHLGPTDLAAVISPGAHPLATEDFTSDKARLLAAIENFTGTKLKSYTQEVSGPFGSGPREKEKMGTDSERAYRVRSLSSSLEGLARHLDPIQGRRKAVLLFSEGVDYDTGDVMGKYQRYASEVTHALSRAVGALIRTNTVVYSIDPRGLTTSQGDLIEDPIREVVAGNPQFVSERDFQQEFERSVWSLRDLAAQTGGFLATDKGMRRAFEQIVEESSSYYIIRYSPARPARPGESRRITVRVSRPGVDVVARKGYTVPRLQPLPRTASPAPDLTLPQRGMSRARPGADVALRTPSHAPARVSGIPADLADLLASPVPQGGLPLRVQAIPFRAGDKKGDVRILIEVLGAGLQFADREGHAEERIQLAMLTIDSQSRAANGRSTTIDLRLPAGELDRVRRTGVRWLSQVELASGRYQIRVAGRAVRTGATGVVTHKFEVPRFAPRELSMSDITLTSLAAVVMPTRGMTWLEGTLQTPPSAARRFVRGDQVTAAVELYSPAAIAPRTEVVA